MAQATGAQGVPLISVVAGAIFYSLDQGVTWTEALAPGSPGNSSAPVSGNGTVATPFTIAAAAVPLTALAHQADQTVAGNVSGGSASPIALTATQLTALVNAATPSAAGLMSAAQASALQGGLPVFVSTPVAVDLVTQTLTGVVIVPAVTGKTFIPIRILSFNVTTTGAITGAATMNIGNNTAKTNVLASSTTISTTAGFNLGVGGMLSANTPGGTTYAQGAATLLDLTVVATGATAWLVDVIAVGFYI